MLKNIRISSVIHSANLKPLISLLSDTTIKTFVDTMKNCEISSCPIYEINDDGDKVYTGLLLFNLLGLICAKDILNHVLNRSCCSMSDWEDDPVKELGGNLCLECIYKVIVDLAAQTPWIFHSNDLLHELLLVFTNAKHHRVLVIDGEKLFLKHLHMVSPEQSLLLLSQKDLLKYLWKVKHALPIFNITVQQALEFKSNNNFNAVFDTQKAKHGLVYRFKYVGFK